MKHRGLTLILLMLCTSLTAWAQFANEKLMGTPIGSLGYDYQTGVTSMDVLDNAFDGNLLTAYASVDRSKTWVGMDLGTPHVITRVGWSPRTDSSYGPSRVKLAIFEGANREDFMDAVPLYIVDHAGTIGIMEHADVSVSRGFRYVRYVGPNNARCNVAEVEFYGHEGAGDDSQFYQLTNLPTVSIHTVNNEDPLDKVTEHESFVNIIYDNGTRIQSQVATARCRGNASFNFEKKPYRIKFTEKIKPLQGSVDAAPAKAKKWTLINNWGDKTLMRNIVAFEVSRRVGMSYTPYCKPVDVILNGEYKGCYQLSDQITLDKDRVAVTEMDSTDNEEPNLTGGYLIEVDGYANQEASWFTSRRGIPVTIKSPDENDITPQQHSYIEGFFNEMENRLHSANYRDAEKGYRSMLDAESFVKYFLQEQLVANPDVFWSCYMYKDREDGQLHVGPCWDFDNAFNNDKRSYDMNNKTDFNCGGAANMDGFVRRLLSDPYIGLMLQKRWTYYRDSADVNLESILAYVDSTAELLDRSQRLNFMRWDILDKQVHENPIEGVTGEYGSTVEFMRTFLRGRFPWMDRMLSYGQVIEDDTIQIATAQQLSDFANRVNSGSAWLNARLTADIDFTAFNKMIGDGTNYRGCFDGAGHTIKINIRRSADNAGLFNYMYGEVKDLHVTGDITTSKKYAGGIASQAAGIFSRCISTVNIHSSVNGDGTHGGIMGISNGAICDNCVFAGSIMGPSTTCCGGFVGWASADVQISNSLMIGTFNVSTNGSNIFSRNDVYVHIDNSYFCTTWGAGRDAGCTQVSEEQVKSGEVCFRLNHEVSDGTQTWYQTLGEDKYPVPDNSHKPVYTNGKGRYFNDKNRLELIDGTSYTMDKPTYVSEFIYNRNFHTRLEPLFMPLEIDVAYLKTLGLNVYQINGVRSFDRNGDGINEISYLEVEPLTKGSLKASTPYIVRADSDGYRDVTVECSLLDPSVTEPTTMHGEHLDVEFVGVYGRIMSSSLRRMGAYLVSGESLSSTAISILHMCRWYALLHMTDGSDQPTELPIVEKGNEEVLGVLNMRADEQEQERYDLSGRRISSDQRGIQVMKGLKVLRP